MSKKTTTKAKATKSAKATPTTQVKKDAKGRFWLVPKDGGAEQGPFATKKEALDAKAGAPAETKPAKAAAKPAKASAKPAAKPAAKKAPAKKK